MPVFRTPKVSARVQTRDPVSGPPRECLSVLMHCLDINDLPPEVTTRTPERAAKYLIVLEMFPRLRHLLSCPATNLPHPVAVSDPRSRSSSDLPAVFLDVARRQSMRAPS
ncbi:hypothetical protein VKT23_019230 [Stygiomarasmius scandens]|uniref:Uncharacterized protein n=1 Tax=Marasmiellus scandens TaxID=2682957 RepID=A0ABR1ILZ0_9AGAR